MKSMNLNLEISISICILGIRKITDKIFKYFNEKYPNEKT